MELKLKPLEKQVIVITGAASSIGLATALAASLRGAKLVLAAHSADVLTTIVEKINVAGGEAIGVPTNLGNRESLEALARTAIRHFGRIDTWINDAGLSMYGRLDQSSEADSRALVDTNFWSVVNGSLIALRHLKQTGGALINLGSEMSDAAPLRGMYTASKNAVKGFHDALRIETMDVDRAPVSVTLIQPSSANAHPEPEQVADAILDAATKATRYAHVGPSKMDALLRSLASTANDTKRYGHAHGTRSGKTLH